MNQNEPFFQNLYMRGTEKPKTFVLSYIEIQMNDIKKRT